ncbi:MAG: ferrous iron transport protein B [Bacteroidia bacterium]
MKESKAIKNVYLVGNPNCGKSTIFNILTGLQQKTSNLPGTTIDIRKSKITSKKQETIRLFDLPGIYSINPASKDEQIACEPILNPEHNEHPDHVVVIVDASNLKRNLLLFTQVSDLGIPVSLVLNMKDIAVKKGIVIDIERLERELGVKVIETSARNGLNLDKLKELIFEQGFKSHFNCYVPPSLKEFFTDLTIDLIKYNDYQALQIVYKNTDIVGGKAHQKIFEEQRAMEVIVRYKAIDGLLSRCVTQTTVQKQFTKHIDKIVTHPILGYIVFLLIIFVIFQAVFSLALYPMEWIEQGFNLTGNYISDIMPNGIWQSLVVNGILAGLSGVIVFIPQIVILFLFLAILEDSGYMARVSFILDKIMRKFGMNGRSVLPLISGAACAIPAIMSARTIENKRDRLITIMVTPFISCSARLPVYILLISIIPIHSQLFGIFNYQGVLLMAMYFLGVITSLLAGVVLSWFIKNTDTTGFFMELPKYQLPRLKNILITCFNKAKSFVWEAGKIIFLVCLALWFLTSFGPSQKFKEIEEEVAYEVRTNKITTDQANLKLATQKQQYSYAGYVGKSIEPLIKPLGFDWRIGIALITSFIAREVFTGSMATIYGVEQDDFINIRKKMQAEINPVTKKSFFSVAVCLSLMVFYALAMQCASTIAVVYKETKSWKWPLIQFIFMSITAWLGSWAVFNIFS